MGVQTITSSDKKHSELKIPSCHPAAMHRGLTGFGIENKDAFMPDCGVHYLWFAFVCSLIRSHPHPRGGGRL